MALTRLPSFTLLNTDSYTFGNANVSGNISAGNLKTDHLLYANGTAWQFSNYANSNVASYLPTYTGNVAANYFIGNGSSLTSITGANVTGQVGNALVAGTIYTAAQPNITSVGTLTSLTVTGNVTAGNIAGGNLVSANYVSGNGSLLTAITGSNVTGNVGNATHAYVADAANSVAVANVTGIGNIATVNLDGNTSNILYGNGTFAAAPITYANSNVAAYLPTYTGNITAGNITISGKTILSNVGNLTITGGYSGQMLQTDGSGNLSWVTPTGTTISVDNFTADGTTTAYTLSVTPTSKSYTMVAMAGTLQPRTVYSLSGNVITFSSAPPATAPIEITTFSSIMGFGTTDITANSFTANSFTTNTFTSNTASANTLTANTLSGNIISSSANLTVNTLSANSVTNTGTGIPTINSATSINFTASTVVRTTSSPFQFYNCTTTVRDTIAASNGYVIYNTTTNKLQVYANGTWVDLH